MFVTLRKIVVTEGNANQIVQGFSDSGVFEEQEGFVDLTVMSQKAQGGEEEVVVMIRWESEEAREKWEKSDADLVGHIASLENQKPEYILRQEGGRYEVEAVKLKAGNPSLATVTEDYF